MKYVVRTHYIRTPKLAGESVRATRYVVFSPTDFACENSNK